MNLNNQQELEHYFANHFDTILFPVLAENYFSEKDYPRAKKVCEIGLKHHPDQIDGLFILAKVAYAKKDWNTAEKHLKQLQATGKVHLPANELLVTVQKKLKRADKTLIKSLEKILKQDPLNIKAQSQLKKLKNVKKRTKKQTDTLPPSKTLEEKPVDQEKVIEATEEEPVKSEVSEPEENIDVVDVEEVETSQEEKAKTVEEKTDTTETVSAEETFEPDLDPVFTLEEEDEEQETVDKKPDDVIILESDEEDTSEERPEGPPKKEDLEKALEALPEVSLEDEDKEEEHELLVTQGLNPIELTASEPKTKKSEKVLAQTDSESLSDKNIDLLASTGALSAESENIREPEESTGSKAKEENEISDPIGRAISEPKPPQFPQKGPKINPRMATFTMVSILENQGLFTQALEVLDILEEKGENQKRIAEEREIIQQLINSES